MSALSICEHVRLRPKLPCACQIPRVSNKASKDLAVPYVSSLLDGKIERGKECQYAK